MTKVRSIVEELWSPMEEVLREGARKLCQSVLEEEAQNYVDDMAHIVDEMGRKREMVIPLRGRFSQALDRSMFGNRGSEVMGSGDSLRRFFLLICERFPASIT